MKKIALLILIFSYWIPSQSQNKKIVNKNKSLKEIYYVNSDNEKHGEYLYKYDNIVQASGQYLGGKKSGRWQYQSDPNFKINAYYTNGEKDSIWNYYDKNKLIAKINYITNKREGFFTNGDTKSIADSINGEYIRKVFYEDGQLKTEIRSSNNYSTIKGYDEKGELVEHIEMKNELPFSIIKSENNNNHQRITGNIKDGTGIYNIEFYNSEDEKYQVSKVVSIKNSLLHGNYQEYFIDGKLREEGEYENGYMVGNWKVYENKDGYKFKEEFIYDIKDSIRADSLKNIGFKIPEKGIFLFAVNMPSFNKESGVGFQKFIAQNLIYPKDAVRNKIKGTVYVIFVVNNYGEVINEKIARGVDSTLDKEALRVIKISPYWRPGFADGEPVKVRFIFPIKFKLQY